MQKAAFSLFVLLCLVALPALAQTPHLHRPRFWVEWRIRW